MGRLDPLATSFSFFSFFLGRKHKGYVMHKNYGLLFVCLYSCVCMCFAGYIDSDGCFVHRAVVVENVKLLFNHFRSGFIA